MKEFFLRTERLGFSIWNEQDEDDAIELWGSPAVTKYIAANGTMTREQACLRLKTEIRNHEESGVQYWPVYLLETGDNIGCCGLRPYDPGNNVLELGVHIKEKYWRKGYANEACSAVIGHAFNTLGVKALFAGHNPQNAASAQMLTKLGFKYTHDEFYKPTGLYHPSYLLAKQGE